MLLGLLCLFYLVGAAHADAIPTSPIVYYGLFFGILLSVVIVLAIVGWLILRRIPQQKTGLANYFLSDGE